MSIGNFDPVIFPEGEERDGKYTIPMQIYKDDLCKVWRYELHFKQCLKKGYRIRPTVLDNYFDLLKKVPTDNFKSKEAYIDNLKAETLDKLTRTDHDFNIENAERSLAASLFVTRIGMEEDILVNYTLSEFLTIFFNRIKHDNSLQKVIVEKTAFMEHAYTELYQYLSRVPGEKQPKFYSYTVIVGYLAAAFGLVISEESFYSSPAKEPYYTSFLNSRAKHSCMKAKKKLTAKGEGENPTRTIS